LHDDQRRLALQATAAGEDFAQGAHRDGSRVAVERRKDDGRGVGKLAPGEFIPPLSKWELDARRLTARHDLLSIAHDWPGRRKRVAVFAVDGDDGCGLNDAFQARLRCVARPWPSETRLAGRRRRESRAACRVSLPSAPTAATAAAAASALGTTLRRRCCRALRRKRCEDGLIVVLLVVEELGAACRKIRSERLVTRHRRIAIPNRALLRVLSTSGSRRRYAFRLLIFR
jgi:hypothetical protein